MRIPFTPPSEYEFKVLFSSTPLHKGSGLDDISIFQPKRLHRSVGNRRGAGIFSFIAKRVLPFIFKAAKPAAKQFVSSVVKDTIKVKGKKPLKQSLKKHGIKALKDTGLNLLSGSGKIMKKRRKRRRKYKGRITSKYLTINERKKKNGNNRKTRRRYENDIFSTI